MKKRKQWLMLVCIALAVCLVSGGMLYIRQKNNNKFTYRKQRMEPMTSGPP